MSGSKLVRAMRDGDLPPPRLPRWGKVAGRLVSIVTLVALSCLVYFAFRLLSIPDAQPTRITPPERQLAANPIGTPGWTAKDIARCDGLARAASDAEIPAEMAFANPSVTDGVAVAATLIECRITAKVERFCHPAEKAALVAMINDYLGRTDLIKLGIAVQGAPMALLGALLGGEIAAGSEIYNMQRDATFAVMKHYEARIAAGLQALGREGIVTASDFGAFMGMGVPSTITGIFEGVTVDRQHCA